MADSRLASNAVVSSLFDGASTHRTIYPYLDARSDPNAFSARGRKPGEPRRSIILDNTEFIRRYLMHVLPAGFQKIRYYGFLNNRSKSKNLKLIFTIQGYQRFRTRYTALSMAELIKAVWKTDICICPECGCHRMRSIGRTYGTSYAAR